MKKRLLIAAGIMLAAFAYNAWIAASGFFPDPDSFYHTRMAMLMAERPVVREFPWLTETVFADAYVDHHWLYHLALVPFVVWGDPVLGMRLATLLFASTVPALAFLVVARWGSLRLAALAAAVLILNNPFGFRINLAKAPAFSVLTLLAAVWAIERRNPWAIAAVAAFYVWSYNGWPMLLVVAGAFAAASVADAALSGGRAALGRAATWRAALLPSVAALAGVAVGLVANPYFPENVRFSWLHIVRIGIIGFRDAIGVGGEWYPIAPLTSLAQNSGVFALLLAGLVSLVVALGVSGGAVLTDPRRGAERRRALWLTLLAVGLFALTVRSRRNVEYFVPFAVLAGAALIRLAAAVVPREERERLAASFWELRAWQRIPVVAILTFLVPLVLFRDIRSLKHDFDVGVPPTRYAGLSAWLEENAPAGAVLWHNDWDDFPYFFLHTTRVRFLVGLDPTFMYVKSPERYWTWVRQTRGEGEDRIGRELVRTFGARYAFVDMEHRALAARFAADSEMIEVYRDQDGILYALPQP